MNKVSMITLLGLLLAATPAVAQMADTSGQPGNMLENAYHQTGMSTMGRIAAVDLANGTLTLDTGYQFKLAPNFEFTSAPALGQDVQVIYDEQGGQKVAHDIELGGTNSHNNAGGN
jgi:hypothetical protein